MRIYTWLDYQNRPENYEVNAGLMPSKTVPDQSMSIRKIMDRYASGLPVKARTRVPIYKGEADDLPDLDKMDLAERQAALERAAAELEEIKARLKEKAAQQKADQNPTVQRTAGQGADQGQDPEPAPIS